MKISQREARRLKKRVQDLEQILEAQRRSWVSDWPGGTHIALLEWGQPHLEIAKISTARKLGHAVVVTDVDRKRLEFRALPLPVKP